MATRESLIDVRERPTRPSIIYYNVSTCIIVSFQRFYYKSGAGSHGLEPPPRDYDLRFVVELVSAGNEG